MTEIKLPKIETTQMVMHRIHPQVTNDLLQNYMMDFLKEKCGKPLAFIANKFKQGSSASIQFLSETHYSDAYKQLVQDEFTLGLVSKFFPQPPALVSIEEGTRRLDC